MFGEHKEVVAHDIIDGYLESQDIGGLYGYMQDKETQEPALYSMCSIWSLEKEQEERTIFWNVFSYKDARSKYDMICRIIKLIIDKQELSPPIIKFAEKEISVWAMLYWALTGLQGMGLLKALEAIGSFMKGCRYDAGRIAVLETVYWENLQQQIPELLECQDGYQAKKLLAKLPDEGQKAVLLKEAEDRIRQVEQKIQDRLYTPTNLEKTQGGVYFIVDCWHDRVLYSEKLCDIGDCEVLDADLHSPHSVCQGKGLYAVENTDAGSVCFYKRAGKFVKLGEIPVGRRPHRIQYDERREMFWVLAAESQEIYGIGIVDDCIELCFRQKIQELKSSYVRSMRMIGDRFYIVSGPGYILELSFQDGKFLVERTYAVPDEYLSMNDIAYFQGYFWISVYQNIKGENNPALLRLPSLDDFGTERCVDLYDILGMKGIPYFFSWVDGKLCIPEIDTYSRIVLYDAREGKLKVNRVLYDFGEAKQEDVVYYHRYD